MTPLGEAPADPQARARWVQRQLRAINLRIDRLLRQRRRAEAQAAVASGQGVEG